ncbi:hypothetical protein J3F83DRAFT_418508 [Trichoderma novae-zelandiae]
MRFRRGFLLGSCFKFRIASGTPVACPRFVSSGDSAAQHLILPTPTASHRCRGSCDCGRVTRRPTARLHQAAALGSRKRTPKDPDDAREQRTRPWSGGEVGKKGGNGARPRDKGGTW